MLRPASGRHARTPRTSRLHATCLRVAAGFGRVVRNSATGPVAAMVITACPVAGCQSDEGIEEVTVEQLAARLGAPDAPVVFDANGEKVRDEYGVIEGATLLPSSADYSLDHLPTSKSRGIVFYCASTWCSAAKRAARRARDAGYADVSVLAVGIKGWKSAGQPTVSSREAQSTAQTGG